VRATEGEAGEGHVEKRQRGIPRPGAQLQEEESGGGSSLPLSESLHDGEGMNGRTEELLTGTLGKKKQLPHGEGKSFCNSQLAKETTVGRGRAFPGKGNRLKTRKKAMPFP